MRIPSVLSRRWPKWLLIIIGLILILFTTALPVLASHTDTVTNTENTPPVNVGTSENFTLNVTANTITPTSKHIISVQLTVQTGWTVPNAASQPAAPTNWTLTSVSGQVITWTANSPGQ